MKQPIRHKGRLLKHKTRRIVLLCFWGMTLISLTFLATSIVEIAQLNEFNAVGRELTRTVTLRNQFGEKRRPRPTRSGVRPKRN